MDGRDFLDVARRLVTGAMEADRRTAAGRAYYALFLEARDALERWGLGPVGRVQIHNFVRLKFTLAGDVDCKQIGRVLDKLGQLRNYADYQVIRSGPFASSARSTVAVRDAEDCIVLLDQVDGDPARRAAAVAAIKAAWPTP